MFNCSKSDINIAKKQLYKRHLIEQVEEREGDYKVHTLIGEFLRGKLAESEQADEFTQAFTEGLGEMYRSRQFKAKAFGYMIRRHF